MDSFDDRHGMPLFKPVGRNGWGHIRKVWFLARSYENLTPTCPYLSGRNGYFRKILRIFMAYFALAGIATVALRAASPVGRVKWNFKEFSAMFEEFKKFAVRGNVIDLAVGVIVGAAFTGIVNSLVKDVITPPIGWIAGGIDFSNFFLVLKGGQYPTLAEATKAGAITVNYGLFLNTVINFSIVALVLFLVLRQINRLFAAPAIEKLPAPAPEDVVLLREIRDLLKKD